MSVGSDLPKHAIFIARIAKRLCGLRGKEGGTLVEFAFILPGFIMILTGTASFGLAFYSLQQLSNATATAAQAVVAAQDSTCAKAGPGCTAAEVSAGDPVDLCALAQSSVQSTLPGWNTANLEYSMVITSSTGGTNPSYSDSYGGSFTCTGSTGAQTYVTAYEPVQLTVTFKYQWLPILWFSPTSALSASEAAIAE
jgi:Flp pilus assembly protein TadG